MLDNHFFMNKTQLIIFFVAMTAVVFLAINSKDSASPTSPNIPTTKNTDQTRIIPPEKRLGNGELIRKNVSYFKNIYGHHKLTIDNSDGGSDAIAKLVPTNQDTAIIAVYIREWNKYTIDEIPNGSYELFFAYVWGYDYTTGKPLWLTWTQKSDDILHFQETRENQADGYTLISSHVTITLYKTTDGNLSTSSVPNDTFNWF
jgi:hypothetical protein